MKTLDNTFNIEQPIEPDVITKQGDVMIPHKNITNNVDYDYEMTRNNLHSLLCQGQEALFHALEVAKQSEHPRAFEVVGNLVKQLADINHQLLDLSEKRQKLNIEKEQTNITNNAIFVGSTAELNKMLRNFNKGE